MNIAIVAPSAAHDTSGNSLTAVRWAEILAELGHRVALIGEWGGQEVDLLVALHARRSHPSIERFHHACPDRPIIVALTGTDLYGDLPNDAAARDSLRLANRIVALQGEAGAELDDEARGKLRVIYQSARPPVGSSHPRSDFFEVCVLSHLRDVKDPLRAAFAARDLPPESAIRIVHAGKALEPVWAVRARAEEEINPRYRWLQGLDHAGALELLSRSRLLVVSSEVEGGANVMAEAVVCGVPVICSRISGNVGMLGPGYSGYYNLRDTENLRALLVRAETDPGFLQELQGFVSGLKDRFSPERERESWRRLLEDIALSPSSPRQNCPS
jgi:putative glycosyltransferase (TIGR04348 family)